MVWEKSQVHSSQGTPPPHLDMQLRPCHNPGPAGGGQGMAGRGAAAPLPVLSCQLPEAAGSSSRQQGGRALPARHRCTACGVGGGGPRTTSPPPTRKRVRSRRLLCWATEQRGSGKWPVSMHPLAVAAPSALGRCPAEQLAADLCHHTPQRCTPPLLPPRFVAAPCSVPDHHGRGLQVDEWP